MYINSRQKGSQKHAIGSDIITWGKAVLIFISHVSPESLPACCGLACMWVNAGLPILTAQQPGQHTPRNVNKVR